MARTTANTTQRDPGPLSSAELWSLAVFGSYFVLVLSLTGFLIFSLYRRYAWLPAQSARRIAWGRVALFTLLALASVGVTWYYMFAFFLHSYRDHLRLTHPALLKGDDIAGLPPLARVMHALGIESLPEQRLKQRMHANVNGTLISADLAADWLVRTSLFRQAWETACVSAERFWWTHQIFGITAAWSLFLGWQGKRYLVAFVPLFMLLGQLVAVAFAMNLFFVALLLSPAVTDNTIELKDKSGKAIPAHHTATWYTVLSTFVSVPLLYYFANTEYFMLVLAIPHLLLFLPSLGIQGNPKSLWSLYRTAYFGIIHSLVVVTLFVLYQPGIAEWSHHFATVLAREFDAQTQLCKYLLTPGVFMRLPLRTQLGAVVEPFIAPAAALLNAIEPEVSRTLVLGIDAANDALRELINDPLVLLAWLAAGVSFLQRKTAVLEAALFEHPAVTSVGMDGVMCWISAAAWLVSANSIWEALIGDPWT